MDIVDLLDDGAHTFKGVSEALRLKGEREDDSVLAAMLADNVDRVARSVELSINYLLDAF